MAISKTITTPAGNVLGTYAMVTRTSVTTTTTRVGSNTVRGATVSIWASADAYTAGLPPVSVFQHAISVAVPSADAIADAENALLKIDDMGVFMTNNNVQALQSTWVPGFLNGAVTANAPPPAPITPSL
jgi:hypothetical protein